MRRNYLIITTALALCLSASFPAQAQTQRPTPTPAAQPRGAAPSTAPPTQQQEQQQRGLDLAEYGVRIQPEPRLIVMMAALDAAGFNPVPTGQEPSVFRAQVRHDQAELDVGLRTRLQDFFERHR